MLMLDATLTGVSAASLGLSFKLTADPLQNLIPRSTVHGKSRKTGA